MDNIAKTAVLMAAITALFIGLGYAFGGQTGALIMLLISVGCNFFSYWYSDTLVLKMYKAQQVDAATAPEFYGMIQELARNAGLPMPKVYIIHEEQPNAFATGRNPNHAAVAATTGILKLLSQRELRGVMAHELAHVKHRDILISTISATIAGSIAAIARLALFFGGGDNRQGVHPIVGLLLAIFAPIAAALIQMTISRTREYVADKGGAEISGDPLALASALKKIEYYAHNIEMPTAERNPTTAQMMIINPLSSQKRDQLFSTHPSTADRIAKLEEIARKMNASTL